VSALALIESVGVVVLVEELQVAHVLLEEEVILTHAYPVEFYALAELLLELIAKVSVDGNALLAAEDGCREETNVVEHSGVLLRYLH
jgi:hypothetical protein